MSKSTLPFVLAPGVDAEAVSDFLVNSKEVVKARQNGLQDISVNFDPECPSKGEIIAAFNDSAGCKVFAEDVEKASADNKTFQLTGPAKIMVSARRLKAMFQGKDASP